MFHLDKNSYQRDKKTMPEAVKYERVQTTEADVHAQNEDFDTMPNAVGVQQSHHQNIADTKIEVAKGRHRFNLMQTTLATLALILFYFCLSIGLTFYQRWFIRVSQHLLWP